MSAALVAVYRSSRKAACDERALVLLALGIVSLIERAEDGFVLLVDADEGARAQQQLRSYELERELDRQRTAVAPPKVAVHGAAWVGCLLYVLVLVAVAVMISQGIGRLDAFERGTLDGAGVQAGQWWRAWTALTLHLDAAHLLANLGAGCWFGYLVSRQLGGGVAWLLTVQGGAAANLIEGLLGPADHRAVGASTAVFTALGVLSAYAWRMRQQLPQRWPLRWAPLVAGVVLLGWLGSAGEDTDLVGHVAGFGVGVALGVLAALPAAQRVLAGVPQWLAGAMALASLATAWACALSL
jgi:membrane associated rhomboid family serine protease